MAKKSNEISAAHRDSIIIIFRNETADDPETTYSVMRYQRLFNNKIEETHVFDFTADSTIDDFYLFDDYALYLTDEKLSFEAIWYQTLTEKQWLVADYRTIHNSFEKDGVVCDGCAIIDVGQGQGEWVFACQIRSEGALNIVRYNI